MKDSWEKLANAFNSAQNILHGEGMTDWTDPIRKRLKAATPGPWAYDSGNVEVETVDAHKHVADVAGTVEEQDDGTYCDGRISHFIDDGDFIAHSITDIANLLEEREILRNCILNLANSFRCLDTDELVKIIANQSMGGFLTSMSESIIDPREIKKALNWKPEGSGK